MICFLKEKWMYVFANFILQVEHIRLDIAPWLYNLVRKLENPVFVHECKIYSLKMILSLNKNIELFKKKKLFNLI